MTSPLTADQEAALATLIAEFIAAEDDPPAHFRQVRRGHASDLVALGVSNPAGLDVWIDEYDAPGGFGFVVNCAAGGLLKAINHGPLIQFSHDWVEFRETP